MVARTAASREAEIAREAGARWRQREPEREAKRDAIERKEYTKAEPAERLAARVRRIDEWVAAAAGARPLPDDVRAESAARARTMLRPEDVTDELVERVLGRVSNLLSIEFFEQGLDAARCVGRVLTRGEAVGTGFLVAPGLMLTNHHVLRTAAEAADSEFELDYEENRFGPQKNSQPFKLQPDRFFLNDKPLDFAFVAVSTKSVRGSELGEYGFRPLVGKEGKVIIGECVNIIQHPEGREKRIVVRENKLVDLPDRRGMEQFFHYLADTERGSSGSPVFNDQWEIVALHHSGVPKTNARGEIVDADDRPIAEGELDSRGVWVANEGVRVSRIVRALREARLRTAAEETIRDEALALWEREGTPAEQENAVTVRVDTTLKRERAASTVGQVGLQSARDDAPSPRWTEKGPYQPAADWRREFSTHPQQGSGGPPDGRVDLTVPLRIIVSMGEVGPASHSHGLREAAAAFSPASDDLLERVQPDPDYADRPGFDRRFLDFEVPLPTLADDRHGPLATVGQGRESELRYHHFSVLMNERRRLAYVAAVNIDAGAPFHHEREGRDAWFFDPRLPRRDQAGNEYYAASPLDRGHLVRRDDAAWGASAAEAKLANDDTFHFTNCAPQHEIYNQADKASARGLMLWGNLERAVSNAARGAGGRISVLNGPIFSDADRPHRQGFFVPAEFWKVIVLRADDGEPRALAFRLSQAEQIADLARERRRRPAADEAFAGYEPFQVRVTDLEDATGLDFGPLRDWDPLDGVSRARESAGRGGAARRISSERAISL